MNPDDAEYNKEDKVKLRTNTRGKRRGDGIFEVEDNTCLGASGGGAAAAPRICLVLTISVMVDRSLEMSVLSNSPGIVE